MSLSVTADGYVLAMDYKKVLVWELASGREVARFEADFRLSKLTWAERERVLLVGDDEGQVMFLRLRLPNAEC